MSGIEKSATNAFLNVEEAAAYLGVSRHTLDNLRHQGGGPKYRKHGGRVLYPREELEAWSKEREFTSTGG